MNPLVDALDSLPLASLAFIFGALGGVYCLVTGSIDYEHFLIGLGVLGGGTAALGHARNGAGKGLANDLPSKRTGR